MATPYMVLTLPVVGPAGTLGPTWATYLNTALTTVDSHDHTTGKGIKITPSAININASLDMNQFASIDSNYAQFYDHQSSDATENDPISVIPPFEIGDYTSLFIYEGDLYYKNAAKVAVQITTGSSINVSGVGGIGGDYTTSTATVTYTTSTTTFTFKQSATATADIAAGSIYIYENVASGKYVKISASTGLAANYNTVLPPALPSVKKAMSLDGNGQFYADSSLTSPDDAQNYAITCAVGSSALTVNLKNLAGNDPSLTDPVTIGFRSSTLSSGVYLSRQASTTTSLIIASGATLGQSDGVAANIYVYALDNAGTVELAVTSTMVSEESLQSTTIMNSSSDSASVIYSTTARASVPMRLIGRLLTTQTTAGTWAALPTSIHLLNKPIQTEDIIDGAVTTAKIADGSVTQAKRAAFNSTFLDIIGAINSTVSETIAGSISLTTIGRPVIIGFGVSSLGVTSEIRLSLTSTAAGNAIHDCSWRILVNGGNALTGDMTHVVTASAGAQTHSLKLTNGINCLITTLGAGTHTFEFRYKNGSPSNLSSYSTQALGRLYAYEL